MSDIYGARTLKKRKRRTKAEMEALRETLYEIVAENAPATVRGIFYLASSASVVPRAKAKDTVRSSESYSRCVGRGSYRGAG